ncbi:hypothetical protein KQX54_020747, partial [Cotesia glomerata]
VDIKRMIPVRQDMIRIWGDSEIDSSDKPIKCIAVRRIYFRSEFPQERVPSIERGGERPIRRR